MIRAPISCDIFCRVVDNFGDIGVVWRLTRQLTLEHGLAVRLFVDDLNSFAQIEPAIDSSSAQQIVGDVTVSHWDRALTADPADLVIEAFAVNLPAPYVTAMAVRPTPPVWINLEYLSAESWVSEHHLLPSPHPQLPLTKYFFFPGFTSNTGGLIREKNLLAERDAFSLANPANDLRIFLFGYHNAAADSLLRTISKSATQVRCTVPEGALAASLKLPHANQTPNVEIAVMPFSAQADFDQLLWRHDVLFVRGEDSFARAVWAGKPFIWQIYPQNENAHWVKLNAFLALYCEGLEINAASALRELWRAWNAEDNARIGAAWRQFMDQLPILQLHARVWSQKLAQMPDLTANLLSFYQKTTKI